MKVVVTITIDKPLKGFDSIRKYPGAYVRIVEFESLNPDEEGNILPGRLSNMLDAIDLYKPFD